MTVPFHNLRQLLSLHSKVAPARECLILLEAGQRLVLPYAEVNARAHQAANLLHTDLAVRMGDTVLILDDHPADLAVLLMACWLIGAAVIPLDPAAAHPAHLASLKHQSVTHVLVRSRHLPTLQPDLRQHWDDDHIIQLGGTAAQFAHPYPHFDTLVRSLPNTFFSDDPDPIPQTPALIFPFTRAQHTQGDLLAAAQSLANAQTITASHNLCSALNLASSGDEDDDTTAAGLHFWLAALYAGASLTLIADFQPPTFWHTVAAHRQHIALLTPAHIDSLITFAQTAHQSGQPIYGSGIYQQDIKGLRHILSPAHQLTSQHILAFTRIFPLPILPGLSLALVAGFCAVLPVDLAWSEYQDWITGHEKLVLGLPLDSLDIDIRDQFGQSLGLAADGEIMLRVWPHHTWLPTGHLGRILYDRHGRRFLIHFRPQDETQTT